MKILVLENEPSSLRGGQEWCLLEICRGLAQRGHEIHLVHTTDGDFISNYQKICKSIVKVRRYKIPHRNRAGKSTLAWLISLLRVLRISPDVIYFNQSEANFFGGTLAQIKGVPLVCHLHVFLEKNFDRQNRIGLKSVTQFIAVSEATRTAYMQAGFAPETIKVVYNGVDLERFAIKDDRNRTRRALDLAPDAFVVIYAGRIDRSKNIEMLLEAFARLGFPAEQAQLLIVGGPLLHRTQAEGERYIQQLKCLCDNLGVSNSAHWLGRRAADLPELFRAADVSVLPSMLPETFGRVLVESMACGTPALGLRYGGIPEVLGDEFQKFQIGVGDISGLTNLLHSLYGWQQKEPTLGQRCRAYVAEHFPVERMVVGVEQVLEQAIALGPVRLGPSSKILQAWEKEVASNPDIAGFVSSDSGI